MKWWNDYVRLMRTGLLITSWFCMGIRSGVHYSTIPDMRERLNTTTEQLTYALAIGNIGSLAGPPLAALSDRFHKHGDLVYALLLSLNGIIFGLKPICLQLWTYGTLELLENVCMSIASPIANALILAMWGKDSQPAMQVFGLGWSIGGIFGPFIAYPFVSVDSGSDDNTTDNATIQNALFSQGALFSQDASFSIMTHLRHLPEMYETTSSRTDRYPDDSQIEWAFWIVMICFLVVATLFIALYVIFKPQAIGKRSKYSWSEIVQPSKWAPQGNTKLGVTVYSLFIIQFFFFTGAFYGTSSLITTYAADSDLGFDNQEAALLSSAASFSGTCGRIICIFLAKCVNVTPLYGVLTHGMLTGAVLMLVVGTQSKTGLWVTLCVYAVFYRPQWGCLYTWVNNHIMLIAALIALQGLLISIYSIFIVSLQGYLYERNIDSIFYTTVFYTSLVCIVYYIMVCVGYNRETRHEIEAKKMKEKPDVYVVSASEDNKNLNEEKIKPTQNGHSQPVEVTKL